MGDVAMTLPVLKGLLNQNNKLTITLATRPLFLPFFENIPRLHVFECDFQNKYKGFSGILRLFRDLKSLSYFHQVIDLHNVLRSRILNFLFYLSGIPVSSINKGRSEKRKLIKGQIFSKLKSTSQRYLDVFKALNLKFEFPTLPVIILNDCYNREAHNFVHETDPADAYRIGLAPCSLHELKTWPLSHTQEFLRMMEDRTDAIIYLFGGGRKEESLLADLSAGYKRCFNTAGQLSLGAEMALMHRMQFMITMDSSNMHLSSLLGVKTITLWGATHPYAGFQAYQQEDDRDFQISKKDLSCRPCTVFGKGRCRREDFACMNWLTPELVFEKLKRFNLLPLSNRAKL